MREKFEIEIKGKVEPMDINGLLSRVQEKVDEMLEDEWGLPDFCEFHFRRAATTWVTELPSKAEVIVTIKKP